MTMTRIASLGSTAILAVLQLGLSACITVEQPAGADDESEANGRSDAAVEGADGGDTAQSSKTRRAIESARDGGADAADEQAESDAEEDARNESRADGGTASADGGAGRADAANASTRDGGQSSAEQHRYCGILRVTVRVCNGSQDTSYGEDCEDDADDCLALLPPDERVDYTEYCYTRTEYSVFAGGPQPGTCDQFHGYWNDELECLLDKHCGTGERCVDNACTCPEGAACECPSCGPQPARCEGDTLIERIGGGPCDANRQCVYHEQTTDCAAMGLACDENASACVVPPDPPPPPPSSGGGSSTPGGPGTPS